MSSLLASETVLEDSVELLTMLVCFYSLIPQRVIHEDLNWQVCLAVERPPGPPSTEACHPECRSTVQCVSQTVCLPDGQVVRQCRAPDAATAVETVLGSVLGLAP